MKVESVKVKRPILRYHGGKWLLAPWIMSHFGEHITYCEPFGGAGSVLLRKERVKNEVYNDLSGDVVNVFTIARDRGAELKQKLYLTPFSREEFELSFVPTQDAMESARRYVVKSFMGFSSGAANATLGGFRTGFRAKNGGGGAAPSNDWKNYPEALEAIIERLRGVLIENKDALKVMAQHDGFRTSHYLDPPYAKDTRYKGQKTEVYAHEMSNEDHEQMCHFIKTLEGQVVLSGYDNAIYNDILTGWHRSEKDTYADGAKPRKEVLWINRMPEVKRNLFSK